MNPHTKTLEELKMEGAFANACHEDDYIMGFDACLNHLQKAAPSGFDEIEFKKFVNSYGYSITPLEAARYQHSQDVALIAARDSKIAELQEAFDIQFKDRMEIFAKLQFELERVRADYKDLEFNYKQTEVHHGVIRRKLKEEIVKVKADADFAINAYHPDSMMSHARTKDLETTINKYKDSLEWVSATIALSGFFSKENYDINFNNLVLCIKKSRQALEKHPSGKESGE